jgi:hypothetical protein
MSHEHPVFVPASRWTSRPPGIAVGIVGDAAATIGRVVQLNDPEEGPGARRMGGAEETGDGQSRSTGPAHAFSAEGLESVSSAHAPEDRHQEILR